MPTTNKYGYAVFLNDLAKSLCNLDLSLRELILPTVALCNQAIEAGLEIDNSFVTLIMDKNGDKTAIAVKATIQRGLIDKSRRCLLIVKHEREVDIIFVDPAIGQLGYCFSLAQPFPEEPEALSIAHERFVKHTLAEQTAPQLLRLL